MAPFFDRKSNNRATVGRVRHSKGETQFMIAQDCKVSVIPKAVILQNKKQGRIPIQWGIDGRNILMS